MRATYRCGICLLLLLAMVLSACGQGQTSRLPEDTAVPLSPAAETIDPTPGASEEPPTVTVPPTEEAAPVISPEQQVYYVRIDGARYSSEPSDDPAYLIGLLSVGARVICVKEEGGFALVELSDGKQVWCRSRYLEAESWELQAQREEGFLKELSERESFVPIEGEPAYCCTASALNCRLDPSVESPVLCQITNGTIVKVYGVDNLFYLVRVPNGKICYCYVDWLEEADPSEIGTSAPIDEPGAGTTPEVSAGEKTDPTPAPTPSPAPAPQESPGAVDLRTFLPDAQFDILFASTRNITGEAMYPAVPILEEQTALRLLKACQRFEEDGYTIKIYDAYRPRSAQIKLYNIVQDPRFIADPNYGGSWHQRGRAVDISLIDRSTGEELEMPTAMHTFSMDAARVSRYLWSEEAQRNVDYMTEVMTEAGFGTIETEWWHFEYTAPGLYLDPEIDYDSDWMKQVLAYRPVV